MKISKTMARLLTDVFGAKQGDIIRYPLPKVVEKDSLEHKAAVELSNNGLVTIRQSQNPSGTGVYAHLLTVERAVK